MSIYKKFHCYRISCTDAREVIPRAHYWYTQSGAPHGVKGIDCVSLSNRRVLKVNPDVRSKVVVRVSKSKETPVKRKRIVSNEADRKKKLKDFGIAFEQFRPKSFKYASLLVCPYESNIADLLRVEDILLKQDQSLQTVHMLCRPKPYYNELNKVAISYKNPLCLTRAKKVQPALYNGLEIIEDNHAPAIVHNTEDTLEIGEITRKKMNDKMKDPECVTRKAKEPDSVVGSVCDVVKEIAFDVVNKKASDALKNKATDVKKSQLERHKPNPKQKEKSTVQVLSKVLVLRLSNQKVNPDVRSKVVVRVSKSKETHVKRKRIVSNEADRKKKLKGKSKKEDSDSEFETDVVDSSSDEVGRNRKKLNIKVGLKRKRSGSDSLDSSSIDIAKVKRLISKLERKVKKQESDKESIPKKVKKKMTKMIKKE
nr:hypothetical protein [Tanacetum cinerariifolium]